MKKDDVEYNQRVCYLIRPTAFYHGSGYNFAESYFSYTCSFDQVLRNGLGRFSGLFIFNIVISIKNILRKERRYK